MNVSQHSSSIDSSLMSNDSLQQPAIVDNPSTRFWQSNNYKGSFTSPFSLSSGGSGGFMSYGGTQNTASSVDSNANNSSMNINAPAYVPYNYNQGHQATEKAHEKSNFELYDKSSLQNFALSQDNKDEMTEELESVKVDLILKDQIIKSLTDQLNALKNNKNQKSTPANSFKVPLNYYELFKDLTTSLKEKTSELEETKERLEAIVVALSMNNQQTITANGQFDEQELAHKMITKLTLLQTENENLLKMISSSNRSSLVIELGLLKNENAQLKEKLKSVDKSS
ncbi:Piso0_001619 [Millerozyma farinosa CBS 7064]|uniref:Piso0_001619 protein n=1 Tax=Pichia sorbitophila (strain ATCC MYA-4447 / BCRC 22081 / CBS 7064 / NBRC 10061 / NRRL Y-12695) TaxID=559304 RepID=G8YNM9_PICSO|nr:Piso0_001619 [Millerozyma farinosa CBS 7064]